MRRIALSHLFAFALCAAGGCGAMPQARLGGTVINGPACPDGCASLDAWSAWICEIRMAMPPATFAQFWIWFDTSGPGPSLDVDGDEYVLCAHNTETHWSFCNSGEPGGIPNVTSWPDPDANCRTDLADFAAWQRIGNSP